jgi:hypothetical protein
MTDILCFSRNRCTSVEEVDERTLRATCRVQDTLTDAHVEILVKAPDLEIIRAQGEIGRSVKGEGVDASEALQKVVGSRVGPGIKKIIRGLMGDSPYVETLSILLDECCNGIILTFTRDVLLHAPNDQVGEKAFFTSMVKSNPRMYNSCAALSADSPLMEGLDLDQK